MNYLWDLVIKAAGDGIDQDKLIFAPAKRYSAYMELSNENLNFQDVTPRVELNPYYRFDAIFKDLINVNYQELAELREVLFDITIHFLTGIDLRQGMNKTEFYLRFIIKDLTGGVLGEDAGKRFALFTPAEQETIAQNWLQLYIGGEMLHLLRRSVRRIFPDSSIYANYETGNELLFFIPYPQTRENQTKLEFLDALFLPLTFRTVVYWTDHFGVIGMEETMVTDHIALY
jgi:hypothetical protein